MYDVVIIGSGLSALAVALNVKDKNVLMLTKDELICNNSYLAQGGIAATLTKNLGDINLHIEDTLKAGSNINNIEAVKHLVVNSNKAINFLEQNGVNFDKDQENYCLTKEGGHQVSRILHVGGDQSGKLMVNSLIETLKNKSNVTIKEFSNVHSIQKDSEDIYNIKFLNNNKNLSISTSALVIATGGIASLYNQSSNNINALGNGLEFALELGAKISNLQYMQFHPTTLYKEHSQSKRFLLTEALRGEGAKLVNIEGDYFMKDRHIFKDAAPRDIVSREILKEINQSKENYVYLECKHIGSKKYLNNRFVQVSQKLQEEGYDIYEDKIPVVPAAHYTIGGIQTDLLGQTSLKNLYACGEVASTSVHGANRLASNSLLECVVFGLEVAEVINNRNTNKYDVKEEKDIVDMEETDKIYFKEISNILSNYCNIVRAKQDLKQGIREIEQIIKSTNNNFVLKRAKLVRLILESCLNNPSIGCHYIKEENE